MNKKREAKHVNRTKRKQIIIQKQHTHQQTRTGTKITQIHKRHREQQHTHTTTKPHIDIKYAQSHTHKT